MAQDRTTVSCPSGVWTQITNADVTQITFQALKGDVYIMFTAGASTPSQTVGMLFPFASGATQKPLNELTALVGANRVWAKPVGNSGSVLDDALVYVDHA